VHYNGTTWRQVSSSALANLQFTGIVARSAGNVWAAALARPGKPGHLLPNAGARLTAAARYWR
jgi:hypothetical protein